MKVYKFIQEKKSIIFLVPYFIFLKFLFWNLFVSLSNNKCNFLFSWILIKKIEQTFFSIFIFAYKLVNKKKLTSLFMLFAHDDRRVGASVRLDFFVHGLGATAKLLGQLEVLGNAIAYPEHAGGVEAAEHVAVVARSLGVLERPSAVLGHVAASFDKYFE